MLVNIYIKYYYNFFIIKYLKIVRSNDLRLKKKSNDKTFFVRNHMILSYIY